MSFEFYKKIKFWKRLFIYTLIVPTVLFFTIVLVAYSKKDEIVNIFKSKEIELEKAMAFTCGSGITACILGLANSIISGKKPIIYDGSWAEYGLN